MHREARRQHVASLLGRLPETVERRPGALGVDVVGRHGRHATPVVDAGVEQDREVLGQVRRGLEVDVGGKHDPGGCDRPEMLLGRARRGRVHGGAGLGEEVLDDHLLDVAVPDVAGRDRLQRCDAVGAGVADADEDAGRERDLKAAGGLQGGETAGGRLVGRVAVTGQIPGEGLEHHALADRHLAKLRRARRRRAPRRLRGRGDRSRFDDEAAALGQVVDRRGESVLREPRRRGRVTELGALAEGEEGFVAARGRARPGDGEDLLGAQVGGFEAGRRLGEGAVAAPVLAEHREGDEDLGRERDPASRNARSRTRRAAKTRSSSGAARSSASVGGSIMAPLFPRDRPRRPPGRRARRRARRAPRRGKVVVAKDPLHGLALVATFDREHDEPGAGDPAEGQGEPLVGVAARRVHVVLDEAVRRGLERRRAGEQRRGVAVGAQPEVHQVEVLRGRDDRLVSLRRFGAVHRPQPRVWLDPIDQHLADHALIRVGVVGRHAALVADETLDPRPVEAGTRRQLLVTRSGGRTPRQHEAKRVAARSARAGELSTDRLGDEVGEGRRHVVYDSHVSVRGAQEFTHSYPSGSRSRAASSGPQDPDL